MHLQRQPAHRRSRCAPVSTPRAAARLALNEMFTLSAVCFHGLFILDAHTGLARPRMSARMRLVLYMAPCQGFGIVCSDATSTNWWLKSGAR